MKLKRNDGSIEVTFTMRMEENLYEQVKKNAERNKRSIRKEIEYEVEQYQRKEKYSSTV